MLSHKAGSGWDRLPWEEWTSLFANFGERLLGLEYLTFLWVNFLNSGVSCPALCCRNGWIEECVALSQDLIKRLVHEGPLVPTGWLLLTGCLERERAHYLEIWRPVRFWACYQKLRSEIDHPGWSGHRYLCCLQLFPTSLLGGCPS